jgi:hypothetical protein
VQSFLEVNCEPLDLKPNYTINLTHIIPAPHLRYTYILPSNKYYKLSD